MGHNQYRSLSGRRTTVVLIVFSFLLFAVLFVFAQRDAAPASGRTSAQRTTRKDRAAANIVVTENRAGEPVVQDLSTGQVRDLTPEEQARFAVELAKLLDPSKVRAVRRRNAEGGVSNALESDLHHLFLARTEGDGALGTTCTDDIDTAAAFFKIDPELVRAAERRRDAQRRGTRSR